MKPQHLLPVATALIGFAIAWSVKPTPEHAGGPGADPTKVAETTPPGPTREGPSPRATPPAAKRSAEVSASDFPLADQYEKGPKSREEAKLLRLTEALGLATDQQGAITSLMERVQAAASPTAPVLEDLTQRGKTIEEGLKEILTPEQFTKFQEIRARADENRTEVRAQQMLGQALSEIDLSPGQREELLARLRQKSKMDLQSIPAAATLLLDKSLLPLSQKELSAEGVMLLAKLAEPVEIGDPVKAHEKVVENQKIELEEMLRCFDGILTPGQMGQYQAGLAEQRAALQRKPTPELITPATPPPLLEDTPVVIPDDREEDGTEEPPVGNLDEESE